MGWLGLWDGWGSITRGSRGPGLAPPGAAGVQAWHPQGQQGTRLGTHRLSRSHRAGGELPSRTRHRGRSGSSLVSPVITPRLLSLLQMLDVTVSQLLSLQPSLAARVTPKHRDVKESWAQLQQALR